MNIKASRTSHPVRFGNFDIIELELSGNGSNTMINIDYNKS